MTIPEIDRGAIIEVVHIDGRVIAAFSPSAGNRISCRCTSHGLYLLCSRSRGTRTVLATVLYL